MPSKMDNPTKVIAASLLDTWISHDWAGGLQTASLEDLTEIRVQTLNSVYDIVVIEHQSGEIVVRGGKFFPERTAAYLAGSSCGGSFLKVGTIHPGFSLEMIAGETRIVTSTVQSVTVHRPRS